MSLRQRFPNQWDSPLNGGINAIVTTLTVDDASALPTAGPYQIACDNEIMTVLSRSGNVLTVLREQEGSTVTTHSDNRDVFALITKGGIEAALKHAGCDYSLPTRRYPYRYRDQSNEALVASDFTARGVAGPTVSLSDQNGALVLRCTTHASTNYYNGYVRSEPTPPWTMTAHVTCPVMFGGATSHKAGLGILGTTSGRFLIYNFTTDYNVWFRRQNSVSSWNSSFALYPYTGRQDCWLRITCSDSTTNPMFRFHVSFDGYNWVETYNENENDFLNDDGFEVGFFYNQGSITFGNGGQMIINSFIIEDGELASDYTI